jgi:hypothetical protein
MLDGIWLVKKAKIGVGDVCAKHIRIQVTKEIVILGLGVVKINARIQPIFFA